jgi:hypothetical protein
VLQRRDERQLDALATLVSCLGRLAPVLDADLLVGIGLHPHRLGERLAGLLAAPGRRAVVDREHPLAAAGERVEARVRRDRVKPAAELARVLEPRQAAPRAQQRVLEGVLGVVDRRRHAIAVGVERGVVRLDEPPKGILVARACGVHQLALRHTRACRDGTHRLHHLRPGRRAKLIDRR